MESLAFLPSVRIQQFTCHLMQQSGIVQQLLDLVHIAAAVQQCLHLVAGHAHAFGSGEQVAVEFLGLRLNDL